ncbi:MAG: hypothetical protein ACI4PQ_02670 [Butyricicoccaceae bacterium]
MNYRGEAEAYISQYPELKKWINECMVCHTKGYRPDMPEQVGGASSIAAHHIKKLFRPLALNEAGICPQCARFF